MNEFALAAGVSPVLPIPAIRPDTDRPPPPPPIPEPETYTMFLAGFGLMSFVVRRKQNKNKIG
ncbi:PEP-CTERM sorting domain-containing protein [Nitrosospira multiformis]|uniref:PEP-CTERM sorting domain-containing protein n=1 Tax=Nitrosospira multiformis TaxID=1231 RepID=UPI000D3183D0